MRTGCSAPWQGQGSVLRGRRRGPGPGQAAATVMSACQCPCPWRAAPGSSADATHPRGPRAAGTCRGPGLHRAPTSIRVTRSRVTRSQVSFVRAARCSLGSSKKPGCFRSKPEARASREVPHEFDSTDILWNLLATSSRPVHYACPISLSALSASLTVTIALDGLGSGCPRKGRRRSRLTRPGARVLFRIARDPKNWGGAFFSAA